MCASWAVLPGWVPGWFSACQRGWPPTLSLVAGCSASQFGAWTPGSLGPLQLSLSLTLFHTSSRWEPLWFLRH